MPDFSEVIDMQARRMKAKGPTPEQVAVHQRIQKTVMLHMEELVSSDPWKTYTAHLEGILAADRDELVSLQATLNSCDCVGADVEKTRLSIQRVQGRIEAREADLALPAIVQQQETPETVA